MSEKKRSPLATEYLYKTQRAYYKDTYTKEKAIPWESAFEEKWLCNTLDQIGSPGGRYALEIGTGHGRGAKILSEKGWRTAGLDYLSEPLAKAVEINKNEKTGPMFVQGEAFEAPFADQTFGLILDWGVFHHIRRRDTALFLNAISGLLSGNGLFLLGAFSIGFRHAGEGERKRNWTRHHGHYDRFSTKEELRDTFGKKFTIKSVMDDQKGFYHLMMIKKDDRGAPEKALSGKNREKSY